MSTGIYASIEQPLTLHLACLYTCLHTFSHSSSSLYTCLCPCFFRRPIHTSQHMLIYSSAYCRLNCNDTFSLVLIDYANLTCGRFANDDGRLFCAYIRDFLKHVGSDIDANTFRFVVSLVTNDSDGVCSAWKMNRVASDYGFQSLFLP